MKKKKNPETGKGWRLFGLKVEPVPVTLPNRLDHGQCLTPCPIPCSLLGTLSPLFPLASASQPFPGAAHTGHSPSAELQVGEPWQPLGPWRSDGPRKRVCADCPAWAPALPLLGAGSAPSRDGEGGHPGAGGLWLGRSSLEQGKGVASLGVSTWGKRVCWVPLAKSEKVNDPRMKTPVLPTLPGINHCQWEGDCPVSLAPPSGWGRADLSGDPGILGSPRFQPPHPPSVEAAQPRRAGSGSQAFAGPQVASGHPEKMRAWRALRTAGGGDAASAPHSARAA